MFLRRLDFARTRSARRACPSLFADDGTYEIEIMTDAAALVEKLEASSGSSSPAETQAVVSRIAAVVRRDVSTAGEHRLRRRGSAADRHIFRDSGSRRLVGGQRHHPIERATPSDARHFTWTYAWTFASYALTVRAPNEGAVTEWLEGNQSSAPLALSAAISADRSPRHRLALSDAGLHAHRARGWITCCSCSGFTC